MDAIVASLILKTKEKDSNKAIGLQQPKKKDLTELEGMGEARFVIVLAVVEPGKTYLEPKT